LEISWNLTERRQQNYNETSEKYADIVSFSDLLEMNG